MSKIYEALLRAEQERLATATPPVAIVPVAPPPPPAAVPAHVPVATYEEAAIASPPELAYAIAPPAPQLDFDAIRTVPWAPNLDKLPALHERGSSVEQFRSLRTRLFGFRETEPLKSIMISSGLPREGKSFIAANLAVSFARHKATRVLLIDGDMRRGSLHNLLGCEKTPGLTTYLAGNAGLMDILQRPRLHDDGTSLAAGLATLTFIGAGDEGDIAADLSGSYRFKQLIELASSHFDWIVVDSSPVNLVTDGINLASACDAVLMVARGGVTRFEAAQKALTELKSSKILGIVLNAVQDVPTTVGYYSYDGYDSVKPTAEPAAP